MRMNVTACRGLAIARPLDEHTGDPHARMRLLQRQRPRVHDAVLIVRALPAERSVLGPRLDDQLVRLLEALAVVSGIHPGGELLLAAAAHEAGHEASA